MTFAILAVLLVSAHAEPPATQAFTRQPSGGGTWTASSTIDPTQLRVEESADFLVLRTKASGHTEASISLLSPGDVASTTTYAFGPDGALSRYERVVMAWGDACGGTGTRVTVEQVPPFIYRRTVDNLYNVDDEGASRAFSPQQLQLGCAKDVRAGWSDPGWVPEWTQRSALMAALAGE